MPVTGLYQDDLSQVNRFEFGSPFFNFLYDVFSESDDSIRLRTPDGDFICDPGPIGALRALEGAEARAEEQIWTETRTYRPDVEGEWSEAGPEALPYEVVAAVTIVDPYAELPCAVKPTFLLAHACGRRAGVWVLTEPIIADPRFDALMRRLAGTPQWSLECPFPGFAGWVLVDAEGPTHALAELHAAFCAEGASDV